MDWSPQQEVALAACSEWLRAGYKEDRPLYYIAGFAGVGKTTIAKELAESAGGFALFAAYTGKAAYVLRSKGCVDATTIHSLIYKPAGESKSDALREVEMELEKIKFDPPEDENQAKRIIEQLTKVRDNLLLNERRKPMFSLNMDSALSDADVLIVDECSMVDDIMGNDLLSFRVPIIVLGDPMQLPPVGAGGFLTNRKPDQLLTEIHRHAKGSGILRLATDVRMTGGYSRLPGHYGDDCLVKHRSEFQDLQKRVLDADQILVGKNATRHSHNARYRELTDRTDVMPMPGDKVVCLRNDHKIGLLNGSLWRVHEAAHDADEMTASMTISSEEDGAKGLYVSAWTHHFLGREEELRLKKYNRRDYSEFDYGYALTVHKSQGSQWDDVVLFDESYAFRQDAQRWLYTGITRAAKSLSVVL